MLSPHMFYVRYPISSFLLNSLQSLTLSCRHSFGTLPSGGSFLPFSLSAVIFRFYTCHSLPSCRRGLSQVRFLWFLPFPKCEKRKEVPCFFSSKREKGCAFPAPHPGRGVVVPYADPPLPWHSFPCLSRLFTAGTSPGTGALSRPLSSRARIVLINSLSPTCYRHSVCRRITNNGYYWGD